MKWDEMSSRERDALVHEMVLNLQVPYYGDEPCCPEYSTDISEAWEVVEKLDADCWRFDLSTHQSRTTSVGVDFERKNDGCYVDATAPTAPEAICKAALRAMGVEIE